MSGIESVLKGRVYKYVNESGNKLTETPLLREAIQHVLSHCAGALACVRAGANCQVA